MELQTRIHQFLVFRFGKLVGISSQNRQQIHETQAVAHKQGDGIGDINLLLKQHGHQAGLLGLADEYRPDNLAILQDELFVGILRPYPDLPEVVVIAPDRACVGLRYTMEMAGIPMKFPMEFLRYEPA
jgi:hypothetical protein